jgi:hypothetical protein
MKRKTKPQPVRVAQALQERVKLCNRAVAKVFMGLREWQHGRSLVLAWVDDKAAGGEAAWRASVVAKHDAELVEEMREIVLLMPTEMRLELLQLTLAESIQ